MNQAEVLTELEDQYPDVDWDAVWSCPAWNYSLPELADCLIAAGCDVDAVKKIVLDD